MSVLTLEALPVAVLAMALAAEPVRAEARSHLSDAQIQAVVEHALVDRDIEGAAVAGGESDAAIARTVTERVRLKVAS